MNVQHQQERQVTATIDKYHQQVIEANQVRLARGEQPGRLATITMSLCAAITSVGARFRRVPVGVPEGAAVREPIGVPEPVVTPAERAATT
jgi:hypothetical protein